MGNLCQGQSRPPAASSALIPFVVLPCNVLRSRERTIIIAPGLTSCESHLETGRSMTTGVLPQTTLRGINLKSYPQNLDGLIF